MTRLSLGLWGLVVFHPRLEYLGAVLGAWRHEAGRRVPWVLATDHTCSQLPARSTARDRRGLAVWTEGRPKPELEDSSRVSAGHGGSFSVTQAALCVCLLGFIPGA